MRKLSHMLIISLLVEPLDHGATAAKEVGSKKRTLTEMQYELMTGEFDS